MVLNLLPSYATNHGLDKKLKQKSLQNEYERKA
jgi:hypothetical protein